MREPPPLCTVTLLLLVTQLDTDGPGLHGHLRDSLRIYRGQQIYLAMVLTLIGGSLVPVALLLAGRGVLYGLTAVALIVAASLAVRILFLKIPHASHESRSAGKT